MTFRKQFFSRVYARALLAANSLLNPIGLEVDRTPGSSWGAWQERIASAQRSRLLDRQRIDLVVDVGANIGQFGYAMRSNGFSGPILSFEPQPDCIDPLRWACARDNLWTFQSVAIGAAPGALDLHVSANSLSSSVRPMLDTHRYAAPESEYVSTVAVDVTTLDAVLGQAPWSGYRNLWLKIDTQGFEWEVLQGASETLRRSVVLEVELSLQPLYHGQKLYGEILTWLADRGFDLAAVREVFINPQNDQLLQIDGIFVRTSHANDRRSQVSSDDMSKQPEQHQTAAPGSHQGPDSHPEPDSRHRPDDQRRESTYA